MTPIALMVVGAVLALVYWTQTVREPATWRAMVKSGSVVALALAAIAGGAPLALIPALLLSASGDWSLARPGRQRLVEGMIAFGMAHLCYIVLFSLHYDPDGLPVWRGVGLVLLVFVAGAMAGLLWSRAGVLRAAVMAYLGIIALMGGFALGLAGSAALAILGAGLFILSDMILALELFVLRHEHDRRLAALAVWPLYWSAQLLILLAFLPF